MKSHTYVWFLVIIVFFAFLPPPATAQQGDSSSATSEQATSMAHSRYTVTELGTSGIVTAHPPTLSDPLQILGQRALPRGAGAPLHTTYFGQPCADTGYGIAFDGQHLWYSCRTTNNLYKADALSGAVLASFTPNIDNLGALAWDPNRQSLWAVEFDYSVLVVSVYLVDPTTGSATLAFSLPRPPYYQYLSLAYDPQDDTLYMSAYEPNTVFHLNTSGAVLGSWALGDIALGLAIAGGQLYVAHGDEDIQSIAAYDKASGANQFQFAAIEQGNRDLECDGATFAPLTVLWAVNYRDPRRATAYEIPAAADCTAKYHWINPSGGSWHTASNWDPQGDPGAGDTVIFALSGQYAVDASTLAVNTSPSSPHQFSIDRIVISSTNIVAFNNLNLNLVYDLPEEPSLEVNAGGTAHVYSGAATFSHAIIGGEPPANPNNPPIARLQVLGNGVSLTGSGRLTVGDEGVGDLFVTAGGHLTSAEARLGGVLPTGPGTANVGGDGSLWETGNIAVGYGISGTLTIQYGGRVNSNDAYVSYGMLSEDSQVTVDGISAITSQPSMWALLGSLFVGQTEFGSVEVLNGGDLYVSQDVHIMNGELRIDGRLPNGDPSDLDVLGSLFVGGPGSANLLALWNAAKGDLEGNLIIGKDGVGAAILWGSANTANPTQLDVVDPQAGLCAIGRQFDGGVSLDDGGLLRCQKIELGGQAGTSGAGSLTVDGGMVRALDVLQVGQVGGGSGLVEMQNNALVATNGTYIAPNGVITGTGTLAVGFLGLQNDGTLAPGIQVNTPLVTHAASQPQAATTMAISGALTISPNGRLEIPVTGASPGLYGGLAVTGTVALDGVLALDFRQGFVPQPGDAFTFLIATGGVAGAFDDVEIHGLPPDFEYELAIENGQVALRAPSDPIRHSLFLPWVARRD